MPWVANYEPVDPEPEPEPYQPTEAAKLREAEILSRQERTGAGLVRRGFDAHPGLLSRTSYSKQIGNVSLDVEMNRDGTITVWASTTREDEGMRLIESTNPDIIWCVVDRAEDFFWSLGQFVRP